MYIDPVKREDRVDLVDRGSRPSGGEVGVDPVEGREE